MVEFVPVRSGEDIRCVVHLANIVWPQHYDSIIGNDQVVYMLDKLQSEDAIEAQISDGVEYFLIRDAGEDAGYLSYSNGEQELFLSKIYVLASYQGRGLGKSAINFIKTHAGSKQIALTVNKHNSDSIAFYQRIGFDITGEVVIDIGGGYVMDDLTMVCEPSPVV
jgi:ribosomal protein S18 acetylase RimI-like enzyme